MRLRCRGGTEAEEARCSARQDGACAHLRRGNYGAQHRPLAAPRLAPGQRMRGVVPVYGVRPAGGQRAEIRAWSVELVGRSSRRRGSAAVGGAAVTWRGAKHPRSACFAAAHSAARHPARWGHHPAMQAPEGRGFVRALQTRLVEADGRPFYFAGANCYYLLVSCTASRHYKLHRRLPPRPAVLAAAAQNPAPQAPGEKTRAGGRPKLGFARPAPPPQQTRAADPDLRHECITVLDDAAAAGLTVIRTWAFADGEQFFALQASGAEGKASRHTGGRGLPALCRPLLPTARLLPVCTHSAAQPRRL